MEAGRQTANTSNGHVEPGAPTRPAERSSAAVASSARLPKRGRSGPRVMLIATSFIFLATFAPAQGTGKTVRHHKVEVEDPLSPPELIQAESAIEKKDYSAAEPLLQKVVTN